ncbi:tRNA N(3)-methylcytidine methyltransferase Mettl2-like isoform X1 [Macrobrachium nipponense]|uniref:tRNA N(3)-methylcytidine methyltransferase Mettl2-like isoform X1 n=1 Tax=Macrobrachium nipponense TaxID=159736 RepID=UPI0030C85975
MFLNIMHDQPVRLLCGCCMLGAGSRLLSRLKRVTTTVGVDNIFPRARLYCEDTQSRRKPQGGGRMLRNWNDVFKYNSWDNVVWDDAQEAAAKSKVEENSEVMMTPEEIKKLDQEAAAHWDAFYDIHQNRFFKDRNWLFTEFPELAQTYCVPSNSSEVSSISESQCEEKLSEVKNTINDTKAERTSVSEEDVKPSGSVAVDGEVINQSLVNDSDESFPGERAKLRILEVGCGVGNTIFPILKTNNSKEIFVYGCDFSSQAVDIVKASEDYEKDRCFAFVCDIAGDEWNAPFPEGSLDLIVCIFVLSAVHPDKFSLVAQKMASYLRPGGMILFRDYGRYDLAQLRFKKGRCLSENFYARGDGTRCYFFTQDEIRQLMMSAGLEEVQNLVDRRLQVNRGKRLTMYRVWVQAKYCKPLQ